MTRRAYVTLWAQGVTHWTEFGQRNAKARRFLESGMATWGEVMAGWKENS